MEFLKTVIQHPLFGIISLSLTILSVALTCIFYFRSRRARQPYWAITSNNLISGFSTKLPNLEITYGQGKVENLTVSRVLFWNAGSETINQTDIAEADALRIVPTNDTRLLDAKILKANSEPSRFTVSKAPDGSAYLDFDFLDKNHGAVVQVVHTGTSSKDLLLKGTIKGAGKPRKKELKIFRSKTDFFSSATVGILATLFCVGFGILSLREYLHNKGALLFPVWFFVMALMGGLSGWIAFAVKKVPRGLEMYRE